MFWRGFDSLLFHTKNISWILLRCILWSIAFIQSFPMELHAIRDTPKFSFGPWYMHTKSFIVNITHNYYDKSILYTKISVLGKYPSFKPKYWKFDGRIEKGPSWWFDWNGNRERKWRMLMKNRKWETHTLYRGGSAAGYKNGKQERDFVQIHGCKSLT